MRSARKPLGRRCGPGSWGQYCSHTVRAEPVEGLFDPSTSSGQAKLRANGSELPAMIDGSLHKPADTTNRQTYRVALKSDRASGLEMHQPESRQPVNLLCGPAHRLAHFPQSPTNSACYVIGANKRSGYRYFNMPAQYSRRRLDLIQP